MLNLLTEETLDENELIISRFIDSMPSTDIWEAKEEVATMVDQLIPPMSTGIYACEEDVREKNRLNGFALRLLANKVKK
jgi:hypothetical protein